MQSNQVKFIVQYLAQYFFGIFATQQILDLAHSKKLTKTCENDLVAFQATLTKKFQQLQNILIPSLKELSEQARANPTRTYAAVISKKEAAQIPAALAIAVFIIDDAAATTNSPCQFFADAKLALCVVRQQKKQYLTTMRQWRLTPIVLQRHKTEDVMSMDALSQMVEATPDLAAVTKQIREKLSLVDSRRADQKLKPQIAKLAELRAVQQNGPKLTNEQRTEIVSKLTLKQQAAQIKANIQAAIDAAAEGVAVIDPFQAAKIQQLLLAPDDVVTQLVESFVAANVELMVFDNNYDKVLKTILASFASLLCDPEANWWYPFLGVCEQLFRLKDVKPALLKKFWIESKATLGISIIQGNIADIKIAIEQFLGRKEHEDSSD